MIVNPQACPRMETIAGTDHVLVVDDFYADPYQVREAALKRSFSVQQSYPGALSGVNLGEPGLQPVLDHVTALLEAYFPFKVLVGGLVTDFAVIAIQPDRLPSHMRHPHIDPNPVLGLVYLNPFIDAGTSFYRHREMGIHAAGSHFQRQSLEAFTSDPMNSRPSDGYMKGSNRVWERVHSVAGTFNRFVAYSGDVLHSGDVFLPATQRLGEHRLTQRFLLVGSTPSDRSATSGR